VPVGVDAGEGGVEVRTGSVSVGDSVVGGGVPVAEGASSSMNDPQDTVTIRIRTRDGSAAICLHVRSPFDGYLFPLVGLTPYVGL
jgi:hypothetical protein